MSYHSKHWSWAGNFCYKHRGFKLPCKWCVALNDPDLVCDEFCPVTDAVIEELALSDEATPPPWLKPEYHHEAQAWI